MMLCQKKILYLFFLLLIVSSCKNEEMESKAHLKKALNFEKANKYELSLDELNEAIRLDSRKSNLYAFRGKILGFLERDSLAIQDLDRAIALNPKNISAYYYKGVSLTYLKQYESAIKNFNNAISLKSEGGVVFDVNPNNFQNFEEKVDIPIASLKFNRGISFYEFGQNALALNDFYSAMDGNFNVSLCKYYIGLIYINKRDTIKGCSFLKEAMLEGNVESEKYFSQYCK